MTQNQLETSSVRHSPNQGKNSTVVLRVPKPNFQIVLLGLIALITLFQTFQLIRISSKASSTKTITVPATTNTGPGTGSDTDVPQSMVGGC